MKYTIQDEKRIKEFGEIDLGELFICEGIPFIKITEVSNEYDNEIYNSVRLDDGEMWYHDNHDQIKQPKGYELEIEM